MPLFLIIWFLSCAVIYGNPSRSLMQMMSLSSPLGSVPSDSALSSLETVEQQILALEVKIRQEEQFHKEGPKILEQLQTFQEIETAPDINRFKMFSFTELEAELKNRDSERALTQKLLDEWQNEFRHLTSRRLNPPQVLAESRILLEQVQSGLRNRSVRQEHLLKLQIQGMELEIANFDLKSEILRQQIESWNKKLNIQEQTVNILRQLVNQTRQSLAEKAVLDAMQSRSDVGHTHPALQAIARENTRIAELRAGDTGLARKIELISKELEEASKELTQIKNQYYRLRDRARLGVRSESIGVILRRTLSELPDARQMEKIKERRQNQLAEVQLTLMELEDNLVLRREGLEDSPELKALLAKQKELRDLAISDCNLYFQKLIDLETIHQELILLSNEFRNYIYEHVLWIRSTHSIRFADLKNLYASIQYFIHPANWVSLTHTILSEVSGSVIQVVLIIPFLIFVFWLRPKIIRSILGLGVVVLRQHTGSFTITIQAYLLSVLWAISRGGSLLLLGQQLTIWSTPGSFSRAIAHGLWDLGLFWLCLDWVLILCLVGGIGDKHFLWKTKSLQFTVSTIKRLSPVPLLCVFVYSVLQGQPVAAYQDSLGRLAFLILNLSLGVLSVRLLHPQSELMLPHTQSLRKSFRKKIESLLFIGFAICFAFFVWLSLSGYSYTAHQLLLRMGLTIITLMLLLSFEYLCKRMLILFRRSMALIKEQKVQEQKLQGDNLTPLHSISYELRNKEDEEEEPDISTVNAQALNLVKGLNTVLLLASLWLIWSDFVPALNGLGSITLYETITILHLLIALLVLFFTIKANQNAPLLLDVLVLRKLDFAPSQIYAGTTIIGHAILIVGVSISFSIIGIGWSKIQWLAAAFTVGLGFGLQEIFANFVSGLILLFEQPFRIGDAVSIGNVTGIVTKIRMRATTIRDFHRKELIVPNKEFITGQLINLTLTDPVIRIDVPVKLHHQTDVDKAKAILLKIASDNPQLLSDPQPVVIFRAIQESSLDLELRVFVADFNFFSISIDYLNSEITKEFRTQGIRLAYPQRDVHLYEAGKS
ncbi:MAG: mechanosensitive ion channel [Candidatus Cloacimonetes bacterium]|nr:mechanosensitive ion channel [Candidatus Cloacimonadota bacterium]